MFRSSLIVAALLAGLAAGWQLRGELARDACLDAGGQWRVAGGVCEGVRTG